MNTSLTFASAFTLFPAIALGVFVSALTPAWLLGPALGFAFLLVFVGGIVRFFGVVAGFLLRMLVWSIAAGMVVIALYAIALEPQHSLLAWIVILAAVIAIISTPPARRSAA